MKDLLIIGFIAILIQRAIKFRVKKTAANTSVADRSVTSVKQLFRWKEDNNV
jgi:hypothetical protein